VSVIDKRVPDRGALESLELAVQVGPETLSVAIGLFRSLGPGADFARQRPRTWRAPAIALRCGSRNQADARVDSAQIAGSNTLDLDDREVPMLTAWSRLLRAA
jgi:hypothetical protein